MGENPLTRLSHNLEQSAINENSLVKIQIELFDRLRKKAAKEKGQEIKQYLESKALFYDQKTSNYEYQISENVNLFISEIQKIINSYEEIFVCLLKIMQNAQNEQKTCLSNIAVLEGEKISENARLEDYDKDDIKNINSIISNLQFAYIQKKVNLQVIVNECDARILWIIDNMKKDIESSYKTKELSLTTINASRPSQKLFKKLKNVFTGKKKYTRFLEEFKTTGLQEVQNDVKEKITYLSYVLEGILKQTDQTREKINSKDNKTKVA